MRTIVIRLLNRMKNPEKFFNAIGRHRNVWSCKSKRAYGSNFRNFINIMMCFSIDVKFSIDAVRVQFPQLDNETFSRRLGRLLTESNDRRNEEATQGRSIFEE